MNTSINNSFVMRKLVNRKKLFALAMLAVSSMSFSINNLLASAPSWTTPTGLQYSMPVYYALTDTNGNKLTNTNSELAVFNGTNVVGVGHLSTGPSGPTFQLVVYSSTPTASGLTLKVYNGATDGIWNLTNSITFQSGSTNNGSLISPVIAIVTPPSQTITFLPIGSLIYSNGLTTNLAATSSSGLAVSFNSPNSNLVSISGNVLTVLGAGTATIVASQPGGSNSSAAIPVTNQLVIAQATASINFSGTNSVTYDGNPKTVTATTAPSNLNVLITYNGSSNAPSTAGTYLVVGTVQDSNYQGTNSAALTILQGSNSIAPFNAIPTQTFASNSTLTISPPLSSSGLPVTLSVLSGPATISGSTVTFTGTGTVILAADQVGNANYLPASEVTTSFIVAPAAASTNVPLTFINGSTVIRRR
jgi:MBG domain